MSSTTRQCPKLPEINCRNLSCEETNDARYWWLLVILAIIVVLIVIIVMIATWGKSEVNIVCEETDCRSAEYPSIAENKSCEPGVIEVNLKASNNQVEVLSGNPTTLWNYNQSFPGPLIEANKGDTLIVHVSNDLSEPTSITWHGIDTPANMDGSEISHEPISPGHSFTYKFQLNNAGLFWYHSDVNSRNQVHRGLYGVILVKDYDEDRCYKLPAHEKILAFSDLKLNSNNQVDISFSNNTNERIEQQINGIYGNVLLTNGVHNGCIEVERNVPLRLYMVNCATDRFMKIFLENHDFLKIGGDQGLMEKPLLVKSHHGLMLTPGERAEIVFVPRSNKINLYTEANPRGYQKVIDDGCGNCQLSDKVDKNCEKLLLVTFKTCNNSSRSKSDSNSYSDEDCTDNELSIPLELKKVKRIKVDQCTPVIKVNYGEYLPDCNEKCNDENVEFYAYKIGGKGKSFRNLEPKQAPIVFEDGTYIIEITNTSVLGNNFFLHGFTFQHIDTIFVRNVYKNNFDCERVVERFQNKILENKDTIYIPGKPCNQDEKGKTIVRLAVDFSNKLFCKDGTRDIIAYGKYPTECRSGGWIFQSHMLTHAELGQQGYIQIVAECERRKYMSSESYINNYSKYSTSNNSSSSSSSSSNHSVCLTRNNSKNSSNSNNSQKSFSNSSSKLNQSSLDTVSMDFSYNSSSGPSNPSSSSSI
jgi:FtsP/CotA-like multicopper oxidase with cupredoxin domain